MDTACRADGGGSSLRLLEGLLLRRLSRLVCLRERGGGGGGGGGDAGGGCTIFLDQNEPNVTVTAQRSAEGTAGQGGK